MKKYIILLFGMLTSTLAYSQLSISKSTAQQWIEETMSYNLFILKSSFQIQNKKDGTIYGLNGNKDFDTSYSVGVMCENGLITSHQAIEPWKYCDKYNKYEKDYTPLFSGQFIISITENDIDSLSYVEQSCLDDSLAYFLKMPRPNDNHLKIDSSNGKKNGWIIWVKQTCDENGNFNWQLFSSKKEITIDKSKSYKIQNSDVADNVIGGVYIIPSIERDGCVRFLLSGIVTSSKKDWYIKFPFVGMSELNDKINSVNSPTNEEQQTTTENIKDELTPVIQGATAKEASKKKK